MLINTDLSTDTAALALAQNRTEPGAQASTAQNSPAASQMDASLQRLTATPAEEQDAVAQRLRVEPPHGIAAQQCIVGIDGVPGKIAVRRLPVDRRAHDQPVQPFQAPAGSDQLVGQPVEQIGMSRP